MLEALSREIRSEYPRKLLYDSALVSEKREDLKGRLKACKGTLELEGLRVNIKKRKMVSSEHDGNRAAEVKLVMFE